MHVQHFGDGKGITYKTEGIVHVGMYIKTVACSPGSEVILFS